MTHNEIREESMERQELVKNNIKIDELLDKVWWIISRIEWIINEKNYNHKNKTLLEENIIWYWNVLKKYTEGWNVLDLCI